MRRSASLVVFALLILGSETGQAQASPRRMLVRAGRLIDGLSSEVRTDQGIEVIGERITAVGPWAELSGRPGPRQDIDLSTMTVLPGLIDAHTHVLLQGDITAADYDEQLLKESIPFRAIRATMAARTALTSGFTTLRDLETEGAMYADVDIKNAIARGIIPGPRMVVATRAMAPTGMYPLSGYSWELRVPEGVQIVDGPDAIRKAVREQVKYGADWIKFYADRAYYLGEDGRLRSRVNFTDEEMKALVDESHRLGRKVAAHAMAWDGIDAALRAGVNSIEHGHGMTPDLLDRLMKQDAYWCPTIFVGKYVAPGRGGIWPHMVDVVRTAFGDAVKRGAADHIVYGTDAGGYPWTENQAQELSLMVQYGMTPMQALRTATTNAARLLDMGSEIGGVAPGRYADLIAVANDPLKDIRELERVKFVMKGGVVYSALMNGYR